MSELNPEQAVLGCLLLSYKKTIHKVITLKTTDFKEPKHQSIFAAILKLDAEKKDIDAITVGEVLKSQGVDIPFSYLLGLSDLMPTTGYIATYVNQVKALAKKRELYAKLSEAIINLKDGEDIEKVVSDIQNINTNNQEDSFTNMTDLMFQIWPEVKNGKKIGVETGFTHFDLNTKGFHKQNLIILAAGPKRGKTSLALNWIDNILFAGGNVLMYTLEMSKQEIGKKLLSLRSGISSDLSDKKLEENDPLKTDVNNRFRAMGDLTTGNFTINDKSQRLSSLIASCRSQFAEAKHRGLPFDLVVIDYLQLIQADNPRDSREQQVSKVAYGLKSLAKDIDCPILALAQVNRLADKEKGREYELYDLRESGAIEQAADFVIFINRWQEKGSPVDHYNYSVKGNRHGKTFFRKMNVNSNIMKFEEAEE